MTLAHFGFDSDGRVLDDKKLPANLIAEWLENEETADKPFPSYARVLKERGSQGESRYSWTIDFAARQAKAREDMQPLLTRAAEIKAEVVEFKEQLKRQKKERADKQAIAALDDKVKAREKSGRDLEAKAADIDDVVYDLKAVNPNVVTKVDKRTPQEIITNIEEQGRIVAEALGRLSGLLATADE